MNFKEVYFVTSNDNKAREVAATLRIPVKRISLDLDEIQDMDVVKIIEHKTREAYARLHKPVIAEDVALYLKGWNGFPGPFIKWVHSTIGYNQLPKFVPKRNRALEWVVAYGLFDGKNFYPFVGRLEGKLAFSERGTQGWGFDALVIPKGYAKTFAELGDAVKLKISARRKALDKLARFMRTHAS